MSARNSPFSLGGTYGPEHQVEGFWREAERQLYPMVLGDPDEYRHAVNLVRRTADRLNRQASTRELVAAFEKDPFLAEQVALASGTDAGDLDLAMVTAASFALRRRELRGVPPYRYSRARSADGR